MIIGLDTGGTHVDAVMIEKGKIIDAVKHPTNRSNLFECIWATLEELLKGKDFKGIKGINLSTTISTNAIVEGKNSPVAMFIEGGPGIDPSSFTCGDYIVFMDGYIDHRGREIKSFSKDIVYTEAENISSKGIDLAAVVTKFSTRNLSHELEIAKILTDKGFRHVTTGHSLSGKLSFPRRIYTAYLNSTVYECFNEFSQAVKKAFRKKGINTPINILKADGGTMALNEAEKYPVHTILSGPAASVMGCLSFFNTDEDAVLLDIGGTTTDISFLAEGIPLLVPDGITISGYPTLIRAVFNVSIGLGGDSSVEVNEKKEIEIGPNRQGPPMALEGPMPTPSDAMIVLEKMNFGNKEKAFQAMKIIGDKLNITPEEAAEKVYDKFGEIIKTNVNNILDKINSHPVYTIHELLYGKKIRPRKIIVVGGPAKAAAPILNKKFNMPCDIPKNYEIANAIGAALAKRTFEITLLADTEQKKLSIPEMGICRNIGKNYSLEKAREDAISILIERMKNFKSDYSTNEIQIIEETSFNMVRGFFTSGKNIRIRAQVKPGLTQRIRGDISD